MSKSTPIEAYGVKGMQSKPWRKMFKSLMAMEVWAENNNAEVQGWRIPEGFEFYTPTPKSFKVELTEEELNWLISSCCVVLRHSNSSPSEQVEAHRMIEKFKAVK